MNLNYLAMPKSKILGKEGRKSKNGGMSKEQEKKPKQDTGANLRKLSLATSDMSIKTDHKKVITQ